MSLAEVFESVMGRTVKVAVMGRPRAVLVTLPMNYSVSTNWGKRVVRFTGDREEAIPAEAETELVFAAA